MRYIALTAAVLASQACGAALDFIMVGDFGWTFNMTLPHMNFDGINYYVGNLTANGGKIDFMMTMGDNMYLANETHPTDADVDTVMALFNKTYIKDLKIWAIRGNHDCLTVDPYFETKITQRYPNWQMPSLYYPKLFDIGNGKKFGALFVDTCLALCSTYSYAQGTGGMLLGQRLDDGISYSQEVRNLMFGVLNCSDPFAIENGNKMYDWVNQTLKEWSKDPSIVWTATVQHHPMFSKWWADYLQITSNMMPMILDNKVDFYLNGHEHGHYYANYPYNQVHSLIRQLQEQSMTKNHVLNSYNCLEDEELFFGYNSRYSEFTKGEALHQVTSGATGDDFTAACLNRPSMGRFRFMNNKQHGFSHVQVDERQFTVKIMGIDYNTMKSTELYKVTVINPNA